MEAEWATDRRRPSTVEMQVQVMGKNQDATEREINAKVTSKMSEGRGICPPRSRWRYNRNGRPGHHLGCLVASP